jgi:hypothetical protein
MSGQAERRVRVLVIGSRAGSDSAAIDGALDQLHAEHGDGLVIVHGACRSGADVLADRSPGASHCAAAAAAAGIRTVRYQVRTAGRNEAGTGCGGEAGR